MKNNLESMRISELNENNIKKQPMITFIDDDGQEEVMTKLFPLFKERGLRASCAIITSLIDVKDNFHEGGEERFLTTDNLRQLYNNGWEILGHGSYYPLNLKDFIDDDDLSDAIDGKCKKFLEEKGFRVNGFVYPQHAVNEKIYEKVMEHYSFAFGSDGLVNDEDTDKYRMNRIAIGCYTNGNPKVLGNMERRTLEYFKRCVDHCKNNNNWLVFMLHCGDIIDKPFSPTNEDAMKNILPALLDYIIEKDIKVVTPSEGYMELFNDKSLKLKELAVSEESYIKNKDVNKNLRYVEPLSIKLDLSCDKIDNSDGFQITTKIEPNDVSNKEVWWSTSNKKIALVTQKGVVIPRGEGIVKIRVTTVSRGLYSECKIRIKGKSIYILEIISNKKTKLSKRLEKRKVLKVIYGMIPYKYYSYCMNSIIEILRPIKRKIFN